MHPSEYNKLRATNFTKVLVYVTISTKGGVGKSLNGALTIHAHDLAGVPVKILEYDPVQPLRKMYPKRGIESRAVGIGFEEQLAEPTASMEYLAPLVEELRASTTVSRIIDLGGPMAEPLFDAMRIAQLSENIADQGAHLRPIIPATTDRSDLEAGAKVYGTMRSMFPKAEIAFVISERHGKVATLEGSRLIETLHKDEHARIVTLPVCRTPYLATLYGYARLSFTQMMALTPEDLKSIPCPGVSATFAAHHVKTIREWITGGLSAYGEFLPQAARKAA
jgi:hypothetical protein